MSLTAEEEASELVEHLQQAHSELQQGKPAQDPVSDLSDEDIHEQLQALPERMSHRFLRARLAAELQRRRGEEAGTHGSGRYRGNA
jgi:hypothetical protein